MAQLGNLLVTGSSRLLGKLFCSDISVGNSLSVKTLSATNFTATSITTSGLTVNGNATTTGTLNVGNSQANGKISINGKVSIRDYANNGWLGINDTLAWASGVYFGKTTVRTDGIFQVGDAGNKVLFNQSSAKFTVPVTINNSLAANNITATNVTVNGKLVAYQQEIRTIQDLGGEFCVSPTIYIQKASTTVVNVRKKDSTTISISIKDEKAITSSTIQGVKWAKGSKIKIQSKIDGIVIKGDGTMTNTLNTDQYTMAIDVVVDSSIANHFSTAKNNASFDEINIMLYQRYGKKIGSTTENVYSPVGIRMSATGSTNAAPYLDIWGSKSSSDPDTVYAVPSVRLGYLGDISMTLNGSSISCNGYGLYADNVYLNGTIISNSGTIGGFKIGTNDLSNGTWGTDKSVLMCTGTDTAKSVGGSSAINGWCFTAGSKFGVTTNGDLYASNANISGTITSEKGKIGSFNLDSTFLQSSDETVGLSATEANWAFWAGGSTSATAKFRVTRAGTLYTKDIQATSGKIGKYIITDTYLQTGTESTCTGIGGNQAFWAGNGSSNNAPFRVSYAGALVATNATISGNVTATSGTIAGFNVTGNHLAIGNWGENNSVLVCTGTSGAKSIGGSDSISGWCFTAGSNFGVTKTGAVYSNELYAVGGKIGGWTIDRDRLYSEYSKTNSNGIGTYKKMELNPVIYHEEEASLPDVKDCISIESGNGKVTKTIFSVNELGNCDANGYYVNGCKLGTISSSSAKTHLLTNNTWLNTGSKITINVGVYIFIGTVFFTQSPKGKRGVRFGTESNYFADSQVVLTTSSTSTSGDSVCVQCTYIYNCTSATTVYLQALQQSGESLNISNSYMSAVRIA